MRQPPNRWRAIDATRGVAMLCVFVSHFADAYFQRLQLWPLTIASWRIGMLASPTFMIVSGCMLGLLYETHTDNFNAIRARYLDRGVFLLTLGRLLIAIAHLPHTGLAEVLEWGFVTDAIGFSLIVAPFLMDRLGPGRRFALGLAVYGVSWWVALGCHPATLFGRILKEFVFGPAQSSDPRVFIDDFPLLPWFGIYLCSTGLGQALARARSRGRPAARRLLLTVAVAMIGLGAAGRALGIAYAAVIKASVGPWTLSSFQKLPPGPVYALLYGGIGLTLAWLLSGLEEWSPADRFLAALGVLGRTSLYVFIAQYFVFFGLLPLARLRYSPWWPLGLVAATLVLWLSAREWERRGLNRLLTVGLARETAR